MDIARIKKYALYIPLVGIVAAFAIHAVLGLIQNPEHVRLVETLGFSSTITMLLVFSIFPLDGAVALLGIFGNKWCPKKFPWTLYFLWTALWPWFPRYLEMRGGYEMEFGDAIGLTVLSGLAYYLYKKKGVLFYKSTASATPPGQMGGMM